MDKLNGTNIEMVKWCKTTILVKFTNMRNVVNTKEFPN